MVNEQMELIQKQNPILSRDDVALLVALNLADQLQKIKQDYEELTNLIEECRGV
jgi:cell division protein ZapA (FtsZ GTPase activity inhibitor)